jgi:hypothetical protein
MYDHLISDEEILEAGFKAGFNLQHIENEETEEEEYCFIGAEGENLNDVFFRFARLIEKLAHSK